MLLLWRGIRSRGGGRSSGVHSFPLCPGDGGPGRVDPSDGGRALRLELVEDPVWRVARRRRLLRPDGHSARGRVLKPVVLLFVLLALHRPSASGRRKAEAEAVLYCRPSAVRQVMVVVADVRAADGGGRAVEETVPVVVGARGGSGIGGALAGCSGRRVLAVKMYHPDPAMRADLQVVAVGGGQGDRQNLVCAPGGANAATAAAAAHPGAATRRAKRSGQGQKTPPPGSVRSVRALCRPGVCLHAHLMNGQSGRSASPASGPD